MIRTLERGEPWKGNEIRTGSVVSLALAFPDLRASRGKEVIGQFVASVRVAHPLRLAVRDCRWQSLALRNVEDCVFPHHRHKALRVFFALARDAELFDEIDPRPVLAFAYRASGFRRLLEREKPWRGPTLAPSQARAGSRCNRNRAGC